MLPQPVSDLLAQQFAAPIDTVSPTFGGFSHHTALIGVAGRRYAVKAADAPAKRQDLRHEARVLACLRGLDLPVPTPHALIDAEQWTIEIQDFVPGENGLHLLSGAAASLGAAFAALGRALAQIHTAQVAPPAPDMAVAARTERLLAQVPALPIDGAVRAALLAGLRQPAWGAPPHALLHGDPGLHNILWQQQISALLDWEWAAWGDPLIDLAWVWWTMRWRKLPDQIWQTMLGAYTAVRPTPAPEPALLRELALGQIAGILVRVQGQAAAWEEWLRRADWTIHHI